MSRRPFTPPPPFRASLCAAEREARRTRQLARALVAEMGIPAAVDHCLRNGLDAVLSALLTQSRREAA